MTCFFPQVSSSRFAKQTSHIGQQRRIRLGGGTAAAPSLWSGSSRPGSGGTLCPPPSPRQSARRLPATPLYFLSFFLYDAHRSFKAAAAPLGPHSGGRKQVFSAEQEGKSEVVVFFVFLRETDTARSKKPADAFFFTRPFELPRRHAAR